MFSDLTDFVIDEMLHTMGREVTYTPAVGDPETVTGIFEEVTQAFDPGLGLMVEDETPSLYMKFSDVPAGANFKDDEITIDDTDYAIKERHKDGNGGVRLLLILA